MNYSSWIKSILRLLRTSRLLSWFCRILLYGVIRLLFATYRLRVTYGSGIKQSMTEKLDTTPDCEATAKPGVARESQDALGKIQASEATVKPGIAPESDLSIMSQPGIFYFWHQHIIPGMFFFYKLKAQGACVVSPSNDGKFAGYICQKLGFKVLYGSAHKSPITLLRQSLSELKERQRLCLVGDGSRGPAQQLQPGLTYLAEKTGVPLVFIDCQQQWSITFTKSWDQFKLPLPFSFITVTVHDPRYVRPRTSS